MSRREFGVCNSVASVLDGVFCAISSGNSSRPSSKDSSLSKFPDCVSRVNVTGEALISASADSGRWKTARAELGAGLRS